LLGHGLRGWEPPSIVRLGEVPIVVGTTWCHGSGATVMPSGSNDSIDPTKSAVGGLGGVLGAWVESMHHPRIWLPPPKFLTKFHHFSIFLRDFSIFFINFVRQAQVEVFMLTIGILIL
jgi:hypothetical protein